MSLLRLRGRVLVVILLFLIPFRVFGVEDFGKLCNEEVSKERINKKLVVEYCTKAGEYNLKVKNFEDASWYFLLGEKFNKNIKKIQRNINIKSKVLYANIAHSYIIKGNFEKAKKIIKNLLSFIINQKQV